MTFLLLSLLAATPDEREAQRLFEEARIAMRARAWAVACPKLQRSRELTATLGTLVNLGVCLEASEQPRRAHLAFQEALTLARAAGDGPRAAFVTEHLDALKAKLGVLEVRPDGLPLPGTLVEVGDERRDFTEAFTALVEPGPTTLRFTAEGARARTVTVDVAPGTTLSLDVAPLEAATPVVTAATDAPKREEPVLLPRPSPPPSPVLVERATRGPSPGLLGGLVVSGLVTVAATVGLVWSRTIADQAALQQTTGVLRITRSQYELASTLQPLSIVGLIAGVIGGATFGSLAFVER